MQKSRFSNSQILAILKQAQSGTMLANLLSKHRISSTTFYKWRAKYSGIDQSLTARIKQLEDENRRLKVRNAQEIATAEIFRKALESWR